MKRFLAYVLLLLSLSACAGAVSDKGGCSERGEVCVKVRAQEPIRYGEPISILIDVTSEKDIDDLAISVYLYPIFIKLDEPENWEVETRNKLVWEGGAGWETAIKAGQSLTFTRKLYTPPGKGLYSIIVHARTPQLDAVDSMDIYQTNQDVKIYLSGTKIPITSEPLPTVDDILRATLHAIPTKTRYPTLTPASPTTPPKEVSTPAGKAYPPPYP
jgi:hypothetical protein